jgi:hypothetical protein
MTPENTIALMANVVASAVATIGLFLLAWQIHMQRKEQNNQAVARLFEEMETIDFRRKMSFLYQHKPEDLLPAKLTEAEHEMLYEVIAHFESLGFRMRKGVIPKQVFVEAYWDWVIRCAQQTQLYITEQRQRRDPSEKYRANFDWLTRECKSFQLEREGLKHPAKGLSKDMLLQIKPLPIFKIEKRSD